ncbi:uncharacterized protein LOC142172585 [Nicotiana tabacum]|uniref:Uncharacterized protein LOC142172585 n=1 Tax=Nicotiana tabacum TaxID=4097 RepID=A0AC58T550_TOBAC
MVDSGKIEKFKRKLEMEKAYFNCSKKVWLFWTNAINIAILQDKEQHVHIKAEHNNCPSFLLTIVYAKYTEEVRRELWSDLRNLASTIQEPWGVIGDFNVITNREEKLGDKPHRLEESLEFMECLNECGLQDTCFTGAKVTWCDNRYPPLTIWKRLDILVYNSDWFDNLNNTAVTHLSRSCSNHAPLLVKLHHEDTQGTTYFKFLNFWTEYLDFKQTVQNKKRRKLTIRRIQDGEGNWFEDYESIADGAVHFYKNLFSEGPSNTDFRALDCIERCITDEDNIRISAIPTLQEVTKTILSIDANSS